MHDHANINLDTFKPLLRAYGLGFLTATGPRLFTFVRSLQRSSLTFEEKVAAVQHILKTSTQLNRFPTAAAIIIGGATTLPRLITTALEYLLSIRARGKHARLNRRLEVYIRALCSFLSAWLAFSLLNQDEGWVRKRAQSRTATTYDYNSDPRTQNLRRPPLPSYHPRYAGKTLDFTMFAFCRALDTIVVTAWTRTRTATWHPEKRASRLSNLARNIADPAVFATSAAIIMWSWFYAPERLPRTYNHWISKVAKIDLRLIQALRLARQGDFVYGEDTGQAQLLIGLCQDLGLPKEYADPSKTIPIPCELYHCGSGKSCEVHAMSRFWRTWRLALEIYLPLQLLTLLRSSRSKSILEGLRAAATSSSFLATFVASFYYAVCLARTRLGPKLVSSRTITPQMWDSGLCVLAGCFACGWSILLEKRSRQQEIAFFVAPRALATLLPRVYDKKHLRREQILFSASVAVVLTAIKSGREQSVRGVLGRILAGIMKE